MKKKVTALLCIFLLPLLLHFILSWIPVKYTVKPDAFSDYPGCILVRFPYHTGTGWEQVGDENGYFPSEQREDVYLIGKIPPIPNVDDGANVYLCEVDYLGKRPFPAIDGGQLFDKYEVLEWYPVYPVKRCPLLFPEWVYPQGWLSIADVAKA